MHRSKFFTFLHSSSADVHFCSYFKNECLRFFCNSILLLFPLATCYQFNSGATFSADGRSLVIAIEIKILMVQAINNLKNQVSTLIREVNDQSTKWIQQYVLITFTDTSEEKFNNFQFISFIACVLKLGWYFAI